MRIDSLLDGFAAVAEAGSIELRGLCVDSRRVGPGEAFVALAGGAAHGLEFVAEAVRRGCAAVLWEPDPDRRADELAAACTAVPAISVPNLGSCLGELAGRLYGHPSRALDVVGVTGTNGKSSFVHLLGRAVGARRPAGTIGTLGAGPVGRERPIDRTTPDAATVQRLLAGLREDGVGTVAMEVSSHALAQGRVNGVEFRGAAVTNVTRDHLDYHGTMERYTAAKARLVSWPGLEFAILNADDARVAAFRSALAPGARRIEYGLAAGDVRAEALQFRPDGTRYRLVIDGRTADVATSLLGRFNVYNALAVAATLLAMNWTLADIVEALAASTPVPGRMNAIQRAGQPLVVVDYAHTPDALAQCLGALREHVGTGQLVCVFGCGGDRDRGKRPQMGAIAERLADRVIVTDDNPRGEDGDMIAADIVSGVTDADRIVIERDRAAAIGAAIALAGSDDVVLVAGKGHETYQEESGQRRAFDDRTVAREILEAAS